MFQQIHGQHSERDVFLFFFPIVVIFSDLQNSPVTVAAFPLRPQSQFYIPNPQPLTQPTPLLYQLS